MPVRRSGRSSTTGSWPAIRPAIGPAIGSAGPGRTDGRPTCSPESERDDRPVTLARVIGRATTVLAYASLVVAGFVLGVAGSFLQAVTIQVGPVPVPIGLVGARAGTGTVFRPGGRP